MAIERKMRQRVSSQPTRRRWHRWPKREREPDKEDEEQKRERGERERTWWGRWRVREKEEKERIWWGRWRARERKRRDRGRGRSVYFDWVFLSILYFLVIT